MISLGIIYPVPDIGSTSVSLKTIRRKKRNDKCIWINQ